MTGRVGPTICIALGFLMFVAAPMVFVHNRTTTSERHDAGTVSYSMRGDLFMALSVCGGALVLVGWQSRRQARSTIGHVASIHESLGYLGPLGFVTVFGFRALLALPYISEIYRTNDVPHRRNMITAATYDWLSVMLMLLGLLVPIVVLCLRTSYLRRTRSANKPICENCGYSLRGSGGPRCPECGWPCPLEKLRREEQRSKT